MVYSKAKLSEMGLFRKNPCLLFVISSLREIFVRRTIFLSFAFFVSLREKISQPLWSFEMTDQVQHVFSLSFLREEFSNQTVRQRRSRSHSFVTQSQAFGNDSIPKESLHEVCFVIPNVMRNLCTKCNSLSFAFLCFPTGKDSFL